MPLTPEMVALVNGFHATDDHTHLALLGDMLQEHPNREYQKAGRLLSHASSEGFHLGVGKSTGTWKGVNTASVYSTGNRTGAAIRVRGLPVMYVRALPATDHAKLERGANHAVAVQGQDTTNLRALLKASARLLHQAGVTGRPLPVVNHSDPTGFRPDVMIHLDEQVHPKVLDYLAAWHGLIHGAPSVVSFNAHSAGRDKVHVIHTRAKSGEVSDALRSAGIPKFSVHAGVAYVFDPGARYDLTQTARTLNASSYHALNGTGRVIGAGEGADAADGRAAYRARIAAAERDAAGADPTDTPQGGDPAVVRLARLTENWEHSYTPSPALLDAVHRHVTSATPVSGSELLEAVLGSVKPTHPLHEWAQRLTTPPVYRKLEFHPGHALGSWRQGMAVGHALHEANGGEVVDGHILAGEALTKMAEGKSHIGSHGGREVWVTVDHPTHGKYIAHFHGTPSGPPLPTGHGDKAYVSRVLKALKLARPKARDVKDAIGLWEKAIAADRTAGHVFADLLEERDWHHGAGTDTGTNPTLVWLRSGHPVRLGIHPTTGKVVAWSAHFNRRPLLSPEHVAGPYGSYTVSPQPHGRWVDTGEPSEWGYHHASHPAGTLVYGRYASRAGALAAAKRVAFSPHYDHLYHGPDGRMGAVIGSGATTVGPDGHTGVRWGFDSREEAHRHAQFFAGFPVSGEVTSVMRRHQPETHES